jgi:hypothetical protein
VQTIADSIDIPASMTKINLVEKIDLKIFCLRWVPQTLTRELWQK